MFDDALGIASLAMFAYFSWILSSYRATVSSLAEGAAAFSSGEPPPAPLLPLPSHSPLSASHLPRCSTATAAPSASSARLFFHSASVFADRERTPPLWLLLLLLPLLPLHLRLLPFQRLILPAFAGNDQSVYGQEAAGNDYTRN